MTFRSLTIEVHPNAEAAKAPYRSGEFGPTFASLNAYSWPLSAQRFAEDNGLHIIWVDNCWVRVPMSGTELRKFLSKGDAAREPDLPNITAMVDDDTWYLVDEEEF